MSDRSIELAILPCPVLLVSSSSQDHESLRSAFSGSRWKLRHAHTAREGIVTLRTARCEIPVVICEHRLPDGGWQLLLAELQRSRVRSGIIVCSRLADEPLWVEVLDLGAFDLLRCSPFSRQDVLRATQGAWSSRIASGLQATGAETSVQWREHDSLRSKIKLVAAGRSN